MERAVDGKGSIYADFEFNFFFLAEWIALASSDACISIYDGFSDFFFGRADSAGMFGRLYFDL